MSSLTVYRLSGIALLIGGLLAAVGTVGQALNDNSLSTLWLPVSMLVSIGVLFVLAGLPAVYTSQMKRAGMLGLIGFILLFFACAHLGAGGGFFDIVAFPWLTKLNAFNNPPLTFILYFILLKLLLLAGAIVFGTATLRSGVFPNGAAILLIAGIALGLVGGRIHAIPYLDYLGDTLFFLSFSWFGSALLSLTRQKVEFQPASAPSRTEARA